MRKVIVSMNITLDGFMAGTAGELNWHFKFWNEEMATHAGEQLRKADTVLMGRITYNAMAKYWPFFGRDTSYAREDLAFADMMNTYQKFVFSTTLKNASWRNTKLVKENMKQKIFKLKQQHGKNIMIYGSGSIVAALMKWNLIDEYILWIHPVVLGKGKPLFTEPNTGLLKRIFIKTFDSGVILINYKVEFSPGHRAKKTGTWQRAEQHF